MAARDQEQAGTDDQDSTRLPWREALGHAPAVLVVGGVFMYAYLSLCYEIFYGSLGVDPNDVGLSYTGTLARSSGFAFGVLTTFIVLATVFTYLRPGAARRRRGDATAIGHWVQQVLVLVRILIAAVVVVLFLGGPAQGAAQAARDVRSGKPARPIHFDLAPWGGPAWGGIPVLAIHAAPASVESAGKPGDSPAAERLGDRKLLYLGQSGGTVVLWDAATQRAVYVPGGSIILRVVNCELEPPDPACAMP